MPGRERGKPTPTRLGLDLELVPARADDCLRDMPRALGQHNGSWLDLETNVMGTAVVCPVGAARGFEGDAASSQALLKGFGVGVDIGCSASAKSLGTQAKDGNEGGEKSIHRNTFADL